MSCNKSKICPLQSPQIHPINGIIADIGVEISIAAGEAEGLEAGVRVQKDVPVCVVIQPLFHGAGGGVNH